MRKTLTGGKDYSSDSLNIEGLPYYGYYSPLTNGDGKIMGMVFTGRESADVSAAITRNVVTMIFIAVIAVTAIAGAGIVIALKTSKQMSAIAALIGNMAEGRLSNEVDKAMKQRNDEIGAIAESAKTLNDTLSKIVGNIRTSASEVSSASLSSLQESSGEMTAKIDEISVTIQRTQEAVDTISEKVEGITNIATQTNLLSLNASIEAARAGDAGKGFAVVAQEIGKLAEDSKVMADDIKKQMEQLLEQAKAAVVAAKDVKNANLEQQASLGDTIQSINGMISDINETVGGVQTISSGAERCDTSKNAVEDAMSALSAISEENAASSQETGASMQELSATVTTLAGSANGLKEIAGRLNRDIEFFKY
ncbi:methyl-accepting chemotaxis protein [Butyrivibrio sp. VCB2001]|jgi:methyl-accepting chemotaxis protein|uniref:methyl-accepting chemotaxis protein n=1 Tax=Butyrivibrio sp. VCB2001 TaxID=1280667 RepID=UPI001FA811AE|nr:methyl-accepting chemotaxis protein [Butyrivibrio sp. VCB2001]